MGNDNAMTAAGAASPGSDFKQWWTMIKSAATAWVDDYAPSMGAALAYYTVFSIAPLVLIVISIAGLVFGADAARGALFGQIAGLMGAEGAKAVEGLLASVSQPEKSVVSTIIGFVVLIVGATTVFGELQDSLDRIWRAPAREEGGGLWGLLRTRLLSFGMILGIGFLLMVSLVLSAVVSALGEWWSPMFGGWEVLAQVVNFVVSFALVTAVFALIYKIMPRVQVAWRDVWTGAAITSLMFSIGKSLIGLYIGKSGVASGYGAAGSLVVVLVWVYYSAQVFLMGAEFTWVYAHTFGSLKGQPMPSAKEGTTKSPQGEAGGAAAGKEAAGDAAGAPAPAAAAAASGKKGPPVPLPRIGKATGWVDKPLPLLGKAVATGAALQAAFDFAEKLRRAERQKALEQQERQEEKRGAEAPPALNA